MATAPFELLRLHPAVCLRHLALAVDFQFQTFGDMQRLVSGLPQLQTLTLDRLRVASGRHHSFHHQRPRLRIFDASGVTKRVLVDLCSFLLATSSAQSITDLHVPNIDCREQDMSSPWTPLATLLHTLSDLEELTVPVILREEPDHCILGCNNRLTSVKFSACLIDVSQWDTYWYSMSRMLSRVTSDVISSFHLILKPTHLIGERPAILPRVDWKTINDVITNGHPVRRVMIEFRRYSDRAWYNNILQKDELQCQLHHLAWHAQGV
ncbi:hypothetical protein AcW1_009377 [Taiwanofungus camphoratus]|nr:hypothetical protein AcV5_003450 [Antrodia cinnamomea]KAI0935029.1 hypothetical protein AcV7_003943 [Antrodia cinnamomea]KAI0947677.1 hypothetical protein AcW1_009377 [Antrodia cinnamomea]